MHCKSNHHNTPLLIEDFPMILRDFNLTNKTNKLPSSINRLLWHVPLTQVWTWLYNCSNCESEKIILNFKWNSNDKNNSDFDIFPHLRLKNYKIISKKSHSSWHFQQYQEIAIIFLIFLVLTLLNFLWQFLFNIQLLLHYWFQYYETISLHPNSSRAFQIKFIPNCFKCSHPILKLLLSKHIKNLQH